MFTDLFKLTQKPVTVYSSSDVDAPVLNADAGSLKTLLKACLVTGYGEKEGLGYQMLHETEDKTGAVFVSSDPTSGKFHLKIDNATANAQLSVYQTMSAFDKGQKAMVQDRVYKVSPSEWRLIGHEKAFILLLNLSVAHNGLTKCAYPLLFGDLPRQSTRVAPAVVFWSINTNKADNYYQGLGGIQCTLFHHKNGYNSYNDYKGYQNALCWPVVVSTGSFGDNLISAACRFTHHSSYQGVLLFEPILFTLDDGTWSFLPMVYPLSTMSETVNLGNVTDTLMLARTGWYSGEGNNNDCGVPTDFWWA